MSRKRVWRLLLLLALAGILLALGIGFESETAKTRLIEAVRAETGRELRIDGGLRLRFLPRLAVAADSLQLSGVGGSADSEPFLTVGAFSGAIQILPLLRGRVTIHRIEIHDLAVSAARHADGTTNFDDLLALKGEEKSESSWEVEVEEIILLGGRVSWRDEMENRHLELDEIALHTGPFGKQARGQLELRGRLRDQGSMILTSHYWINMGEAEAETFVQLDDLRINAKESGDASPFRLELMGHRLRAMATGLELEQLAVEGEAKQGDTDWKALFKLADLQADAQGGALHGLTGEVRQFQDKTPLLTIEGKLDALTGTKRDWQGMLALEGKGDLAGHGFAGQLSVPLKMNLEENARIVVEGLNGSLEIQPGPQLARAVQIQAKGELKAAAEGTPQAEGQLALTVDDASRLEMALKLERLKPPRLWFEASLDKLDLDRYLKPTPENADTTAPKNKAAASEQKTEPPESVDLVELPGEAALEIEGRLRIGQLRYQETTLTGLAGEVRLQNGKLEIRDLKEPPPRKKRAKR